MHCVLNPRDLPAAQLETSRNILHIWSCDVEYCFGNHSSGSVSYGTNTRTFIQSYQAASEGETHLGSTYFVQSLFATRASELHRSVDAPLKAVQRRLHLCASRPEGPDDPVVHRAAERMALASIESNTTKCTSCGAEGMMHSAWAYWP